MRDSFGALDRNTVLKYLHKCLHSDQQIDRKTGGAGLGLYLMANSSTRFLFNVLPGVATECVCVFELDSPKLQLDSFGFFIEKIDAAGRLAAGPSRLLPAGASFPIERRANGTAVARTPTGVIVALSSSILLLLALIALVAIPKFSKAARVTMQVTTDPPGATIEIDGAARGVAQDGSLAIDELEVGRAYRVTATKEGYAPAEAILQPTGSGGSARLHLEPHAAMLELDSDPQGATVLVDGKDSGKTPVELSTLPPGTEVEITLRKVGYADSIRKIKVPAPGARSQVSQALTMSPDFATVVVSSTPVGAEVWLDGQRLPGVVTPTEEILVEAATVHKIELRKAGHMPIELASTPPRGARRISLGGTLDEGTMLRVSANVEGRGTVEGVAACRARLLPFSCGVRKGKYTVQIDGTKPPGHATRTVVADREPVDVEVTFGFVEAPAGKKIVVGQQQVTRAAYDEGKRVVTVIEAATGVMSPLEVKVVAGKAFKVP